MQLAVRSPGCGQAQGSGRVRLQLAQLRGTVLPQRTVSAAPLPLHHASTRSVATAASSAFEELNGDSTRKKPVPLPLSLYHPYTSLPPSGQIVPPAEGACDPSVMNCKTVAYVYECKCTTCYGSGLARGGGGSRARRGVRRATLHTCVVCKGVGYVRHTTGRYIPDIQGDIHHSTLARQQKLPGEPEKQLPAPTHTHDLPRWAQRAKQFLGLGHTPDKHDSTPPPAPPQTTPQPGGQNNIVSRQGRLGGVPSASQPGGTRQQPGQAQPLAP